MHPILGRLADLFYPPRCFLCREVLKNREEAVCAECREHILSEEQDHVFSLEFIDQALALFDYKGNVRESIHALKFGKQAWIARKAAGFMFKSMEKAGFEADVITWVPMRSREKAKRGFDQSEILAREIAKLAGMKATRTLEKVKKTKRQSSLSARERRANVLGAYVSSDPGSVRGKRILLVDDVITTGSTMSEAARILRMDGADKIYALSLARSDLSKENNR